MDQLFLGLLLLNTENCGFSTSGREELVFFLWGNVPSETGTMLFFGEKHLQRCLSPTEGTPKLEIREPPGASPSAAPCSWITLGMGWDGMGWSGLALRALTQQGHCVTLWYSEWVQHKQSRRRSSQSMRMNDSANENWRR